MRIIGVYSKHRRIIISKMSKKTNDKENNGDAIIAFSEWLDSKGYSYAIFLCKDEGCGIMTNGDSEEIVASMASAMVEHPWMMELVATALAVAVSENNHNEDEDGED